MDRARRVPGFTTTGGSYPSMWSWMGDRQIVIDAGSRNPSIGTTSVEMLDIETGVRAQVQVASLFRHQKFLMLEHPYSQGPGSNVRAALGNVKYPPGVGPNVEVTGVALSPQRDRLAWWVAFGRDRPQWLERALLWLRGNRTTVNVQNVTTEAVLISKPDGTSIRELGRVKAEYAPAGLGAVSWTPDGKSLCIQYRHGLYIIPAD